METKDLALLGFFVILGAMMALVFGRIRAASFIYTQLAKELKELTSVLTGHNPRNLPISVFDTVIAIHSRAVSSKKAIGYETKLATFFLVLTTVWLQMPDLFDLSSSFKLMPQELVIHYSVVRVGVPCVAFIALISTIIKTGETIVKLKEIISHCQLAGHP